MEETDRADHLGVFAISATRRDTSLENVQEKVRMVAQITPTSVRGETTKVMVPGMVKTALNTADTRLLRGEKTVETEEAGPEEVPVAPRRVKYAEAREREVGVPGATLPTLMGEAGELVIALRFVYCPKRDSVYILL